MPGVGLVPVLLTNLIDSWQEIPIPEHRTVCAAAAAAAVSVCCSTVALDGPAGSQKNLCASVHLPQLQLGSILNNRSVE